MYSKVLSETLNGIDAFVIEIETHLDNALPSFSIVGLPDNAVKESRDRVAAAIKNSNFVFPSKKITVNLAPADIRKVGSAFDLPIAVGVIASTGMIMPEALENRIILGELSLEGKLRPITGSLSLAVEAAKLGYKEILLPKENASEAAMVENIDVIPIDSLTECIDYLLGNETIEKHTVNVKEIFDTGMSQHFVNLSDVKGQKQVKRAMEVAAAGGHNFLMIGPPGSGKSMLAKRFPTILPPLTIDEALETTKIHSVSGLLSSNEALVTMRPFRSPHHTISNVALVGGGNNMIRPGEISLAHHGILFLDELPEFARNVLEVLRQPLEEKKIVISRTKVTLEFPANFMLVCSMNPCPCGNYGNPKAECTCTPMAVQKYNSKISGPLMDRIDIHIQVPAVEFSDLSSKEVGESSEVVRERVIEAREVQNERFKNLKHVFKNADMGSKEIRKYCELDEKSEKMLELAMKNLGFSARAHDRIIKVARTIADLAKSEKIQVQHIAEAIQYRSLDRTN